ncbi:MAG: dihydroorotate dehydrogenase [Anaerolineae bacterium]|jgi:dihydroorotate dehydrogenase (NAD+) catalytic subunit|nr:dihydroorotate dehydrogenase [Anaerolineae bacterium]MDH7474681.1 dihydroorotate dehydrogenase [Anaerolineae bacterium]
MRTTSPDLRVDLCRVRLPNPLVLASGILGTSAQLLERVARCGAGAVTTKSCGPVPRTGHPNPTVIDWGHGLINAVGLPNPGVEAEVEIIAVARELLAPLGVPLIASIFADTVAGFAAVAERISAARPDLIEINISCPNVAAELGRPFALDAVSAAQVTAAVRAATELPIIVKLSPNVTDIVAIARAVEGAGADAIAAINTLGPGMVIDVESGRPILANRVGGVSGPAIRPIAVRCVYDICTAVNVPVVGIGGVSCGRDAVEMLMAGATAVGVGSAVYRGGPEVFGRIRDELAEWMSAHGYTSLSDFRGIAHER